MKNYDDLQPHQKRVYDEKAELDNRRAKLKVFIGGDIFKKLSTTEQVLMERQVVLQDLLSETLEQRVELF